MQHTGNASGTVVMYDLTTKSTFRCDRFTIEPKPELIMNMQRAFANEDEPKNLRKRPPAAEHDKAQEVDDINNNPQIRALIAVPGARQLPKNPAHTDAEVHIGTYAPQKATNARQDVAATLASDNRVDNTPQPAGSYPKSTASSLPTVQEDEEDQYQSEDDIPDDEQERFVRENIESYPQVVDETIEHYYKADTNYHQRNGRRTSKRREDRINSSEVRAYKMSLKKQSGRRSQVSKTL